MDEPQIDWREFKPSETRQQWKDRTFLERFAAGKCLPPGKTWADLYSGERTVPLSLRPLDRKSLLRALDEAPITGRMSVKPPPMRPLPREDGKATWDDVVDAMYENGEI